MSWTSAQDDASRQFDSGSESTLVSSLQNKRIKQRKPVRQPAKKGGNTCALSESLGGHMAGSLMLPSTDIETMNIIDRLKHLQTKTLQTPTPPLPTKMQDRTAPSTDPFTSRDIVAHFMDNLEPRRAAMASSASVNILPNTSAGLQPPKTVHRSRSRNDIHTFTLADFSAIASLGALVEKYGRVSHMGVLDPSYSFFLTKDRQAALYYKVRNKVAVVGGEPLCSPDQYDNVLEEFRHLRKRHGWGIVFLGATDNFIPYATQKKWVTMRFGTERVLNPLNNPILQEKEGKRIVTQNRQMLDPERGGLSVHVYVPAQGRDTLLEEQLRHIYDSWRAHRNQSSQAQAYMTVFDPFAIPVLMIYIYTRNREGECNGFAALRKIGAERGYHIDPYCALPTAPRGITDLLVFSAMSFLQYAGIDYLSFGFEPSTTLEEISGLSRPKTALTKSCYRRAFRHLPISGKKAYHDKFRPDPTLESGLYLIYPEGTPKIQHALATLHIVNVRVRGLLWKELLGKDVAQEKAGDKKQQTESTGTGGS